MDEQCHRRWIDNMIARVHVVCTLIYLKTRHLNKCWEKVERREPLFFCLSSCVFSLLLATLTLLISYTAKTSTRFSVSPNPTKAVFTWCRMDFHSGTTSSRFHTESPHLFTWYLLKFPYLVRFTRVWVFRNICSGAKPDRTFHKYRVKEVHVWAHSDTKLGKGIGWAAQLIYICDPLMSYRIFIPEWELLYKRGMKSGCHIIMKLILVSWKYQF